MTDKIEGIHDTPKDRKELNVGGRTKNKKMLIIIIFLVVGFGVLITAVSFAFNKLSNSSEAVVTTSESDDNFIAGAKNSVLDDSNNFFAAIRKDKERKDNKKANEEKKKLESQLAQQLAVLEEAKNPKPKTAKTVKKHSDRVIEKPIVKPTVKTKNAKSSKKKTLSPRERKMQGNVVIGKKSKRRSGGKPSKTYSSSFNAFSFKNGEAGVRKKGSLDFLLIHGSSLPCALYTQIISDYEGFVTCRITQDVYSANGAVLLIEKGSLVSGTQSVAMELGKARIFTTWADIETPLGASIRIDSLGTGQLGAAGIDAWIDNHYEQKFGGAILLSFVEDVVGALGQKLSEKAETNVDNSTQNASDMASKALESSINIQPTGYAFIGQKINILVARDIDMSSIYSLEAGE